MKRKIIMLVCVLTLLLAGCGSTSSSVTDTSVPAENTVVSEQTEYGAQPAESADIAAGNAAAGGQGTQDKKPLSEKLEVHFIDVGQGDATLIKCGNHAMLIDAGNNNKGTLVQNYLQQEGITSLDYVIGTHPDADHIGGMDVVLYKFDCGTVIMPDVTNDTKTYDDVIQTMKQKNYTTTYPVAGTRYSLGDASFVIIAPVSADYGDNNNDYSVGLKLTYGDNTFLFTGDAEEASEADMCSEGIDLSADVYKVPHHGSRTASTQAFLDKVSPDYAVISCGEGNSYGHPHSEVLNRLRYMGVNVFRTDMQGSIVVTSDGSNMTWNCSPDESWQSGEQSSSDRETAAPVKSEVTAGAAVSDETSYVVNTNSKKFHLPSCGNAARISDKNRLDSSESREALISEGYEPAGCCNP